MKSTKFLLFLISVFVLLTACAQMQQTPSVAGPGVSPVIDRIVNKGSLVVGTAGDMPPLNMTTKDGDVIGLEIDLAQYIAGAMGVRLKTETMPFSKLMPALQAGKVDMIMSGMTMTSKRNLKVAFVGPYFASGKAFLTKFKTIAAVKTPAEINSPDTKLTALKASTSQEFVEEFISKATLFAAEDYDEGVNMVLAGKVDAMVADYPICVVSVLRYPDADLVSLITPLTYEPIGVAIPAGDPLLINWLQNYLDYLEESGAMDSLRERWFARGSWLEKLP